MAWEVEFIKYIIEKSEIQVNREELIVLYKTFKKRHPVKSYSIQGVDEHGVYVKEVFNIPDTGYVEFTARYCIDKGVTDVELRVYPLNGRAVVIRGE